jgi:hypothetical protein
MPQPVDQLYTIGRIEDVADRILWTQGYHTGCHGDQEQIVISKDGRRGAVQILDVSEDSERVRPAIDQVSNEPQSIFCRIKGDALKEVFKRGETALDIADCISGHAE